MENIVGIAFGIIAFILFVIIITMNINSTNILKRLEKQYDDGIEIGCFFLEGLQDRFLKIGFSKVSIDEDYVIITNGKNAFRFYLGNGRVFTGLSKEGIKLGKIATLVGTPSKIRQLKKAVEYNLMMDKIVATYNPPAVREETKDYAKALKYSQANMKYLFVFFLMAIMALSIYFTQFVDEFSDKKKNMVKEEDVTIISEVKEEMEKEEEKPNGEIEKINQELEEEKEAEEERSSEEKIDIVKKSKPNDENFTLEEALEAYFFSTMWTLNNDNVSGNKERIIFSGIFPERDKENKEVKYTLEFYLDNDEGMIEFGDMYVYGLVEDEMLQNIILKAVFEKENSTDEVKELLDLLKKDVLNNGTQNENIESMVDMEDNSEREGDGEEFDLSSEYVLRDSDKRYLEEEELWEMDKETLRIARNEIYARYGRIFDAEELQEYFESKSWYVPSITPEDFDENILSEIEKYNVRLIKKAEEETDK